MHPSVIHLASGNAHKVAEFEKLARESAPGLTLRSALDAGGMPLVEEDAGTFVGNARKKALALQSRLPAGSWVLADDSGLCVDALEGAPGVESAYFAGAESDAKANLEKLVRVMEKVPEDRRGAHFVCVLVMIDADNGERVFEGRCDGSLARVPRAGGGFGYDPLFIPAGEGKTFAELADSAKNRLSHRARAWAKFAEWWTGESG